MPIRSIGLLLVLVFGIQLLPLQQMGSLLYQNQLAEELAHNHETANTSPPEEWQKPDLEEQEQRLKYSEHEANQRILHTEKLYTPPGREVPVEPPDGSSARQIHFFSILKWPQDGNRLPQPLIRQESRLQQP
ncbi:MAG TPA: hypothetical protein PKE63_06255 [Lacibacter sp.]|nr:hypothetical protein [Lacibacter sp.]HMO88506.1 hypothetical protein [Lacibacter sp.]HMP86861.1 hypothetical protein [Lacibacter sp.]